jgi:hypothetical protein
MHRYGNDDRTIFMLSGGFGIHLAFFRGQTSKLFDKFGVLGTRRRREFIKSIESCGEKGVTSFVLLRLIAYCSISRPCSLAATGARHGMSLISAITSRGHMRFMIKE